jgi:hypothetical protein
MQDGMSPGILGNGMSPGIMGMQVSPTWGMPGSTTSAAGGGGNFARAEAALDGVRFSCRASPARIHEAASVLRCRGAGTRAISTITLPALAHDIHTHSHTAACLSQTLSSVRSRSTNVTPQVGLISPTDIPDGVMWGNPSDEEGAAQR